MALIKLSRDTNHMYYSEKRRVSLKDIEQLIREGNEIDVNARIIVDNDHEDTIEIPYTRETLYRVAFRECLSEYDPLEKVVEYNTFLLTDEILYDIIENGGIESYKVRKMKGLL